MSKRSPRLQFTEDEMTSSAVHSAAEKARKMSNKLDKAETKIPKKSVKRSQRCIDEKTGAYTNRLYFEEIDKKRPPSKLSHAVSSAPLNSMSHAVHRDIRESEDDNVGVESAHKLEEVAEGGVRFMDSALREQKLKPYRNADRAEIRADKANLQALNRYARDNQPEFSSNPYSRLQQKRAIKKEYAAAKAGRSASGTVRASELTKKAAKATEEGSKKVAAFFAKHKKGLVVIGILAVMLIFMLNVFSSCSVVLQSGVSAFGATTHPADDANLLAAEEQYCSLEAELQEYLNNYERTHDYDEYHYDLDAIEHDPYVLLAALSALHGDEWTVSDVSGYIQFLFENLFLYTKMRNVAGLSATDAQKSSDMFMKCRYLDELTGSKGIVFATGTPVSNSMTELYTMMRYLQHDTLTEKGMAHFDCWASTFGETTNKIFKMNFMSKPSF